MAETRTDERTWAELQQELLAQPGLTNRSIYPSAEFDGRFEGEHGGIPFSATGRRDHELRLRSDRANPELVDMFTNVIGYGPFVSYMEPVTGASAMEWNRKNPRERYAELLMDGKLELDLIE
jgi:hypothetical protein